jgi:hypothetical protein
MAAAVDESAIKPPRLQIYVVGDARLYNTLWTTTAGVLNRMSHLHDDPKQTSSAWALETLVWGLISLGKSKPAERDHRGTVEWKRSCAAAVQELQSILVGEKTNLTKFADNVRNRKLNIHEHPELFSVVTADALPAGPPERTHARFIVERAHPHRDCRTRRPGRDDDVEDTFLGTPPLPPNPQQPRFVVSFCRLFAHRPF